MGGLSGEEHEICLPDEVGMRKVTLSMAAAKLPINKRSIGNVDIDC